MFADDKWSSDDGYLKVDGTSELPCIKHGLLLIYIFSGLTLELIISGGLSSSSGAPLLRFTTGVSILLRSTARASILLRSTTVTSSSLHAWSPSSPFILFSYLFCH
ncbi:unnamed protein product [Brassica oleracea var. botrytis]|uniref:(rape) hypothetical protein n=1 Tax=Brassica napus TaxID=3708 RepID=A0A816UK34_BRANA|nr:unnamed protein product [Brassica napus]